MKIAIAQLNFHIGNFEQNGDKMAAAIEKAKANGVELLLFSELTVCGYPPRDFLEFNDFIERCEAVVQRLAALTDDTIAVVVGSPSRNPNTEGKDLFNSAWFLTSGKVHYKAHKALLPTYDVFDEDRYFEPGTDFNIVHYKGRKIALTVCEDIWNVGNENPLYTTCPMDHLIHQQPEFIVNISASPFDYNHQRDRMNVLQANTERYGLPIFYINHVGAQTELIFDGGSLVVNSKGQLFDELAYFHEDYREYDLDELIASAHQPLPEKTIRQDKMPLIHDALVLGIKDYFRKLNFKQAILGLSGGIDSAVVMALAAKALGPENVRAVLMPSPYSSGHSVTDAEQLAQNLGSPYDAIRIDEAYHAFLKTLEPQFNNLPFNIAEENIQARSRAIILMGLSNKFGYILLNTSNKSETAVGYSTLYGDMSGGLSVLGDVYKTEVYELARYINRDEEIIPNNILTKPPSAELRPDQKDTDSLPDYKILDEVLHQYIERRQGPKELINMGFDEALVRRILKLVNTSEYKRHQTPPILRVSPKAFGMGRRMPIVAKYLG